MTPVPPRTLRDGTARGFPALLMVGRECTRLPTHVLGALVKRPVLTATFWVPHGCFHQSAYGTCLCTCRPPLFGWVKPPTLPTRSLTRTAAATSGTKKVAARAPAPRSQQPTRF